MSIPSRHQAKESDGVKPTVRTRASRAAIVHSCEAESGAAMLGRTCTQPTFLPGMWARVGINNRLLGRGYTRRPDPNPTTCFSYPKNNETLMTFRLADSDGAAAFSASYYHAASSTTIFDEHTAIPTLTTLLPLGSSSGNLCDDSTQLTIRNAECPS